MPQPTRTEPPLVHGVLLHPEYVTLEERGKTVKSVRAEQIESISLEYGSHSHHPLIQMVFGVVLAAVGLLPAIGALRWYREGGTLDVWYFLVVLLLPLGLWVIRDATRRGFHLLVRARPESHKLPLQGVVAPADLRDRLFAAADLAGYEIRIGETARAHLDGRPER